MLSLTSKLAALYAERFDDAVVLQAVDEVEALTSDLSNKIWQKIMILGEFGPARAAGLSASSVDLEDRVVHDLQERE